MRAEWTGDLVGRMHNAEITQGELAEKIGWSRGYVNMVLAGTRNPADAERKLNEAFSAILKEKQA